MKERGQLPWWSKAIKGPRGGTPARHTGSLLYGTLVPAVLVFLAVSTIALLLVALAVLLRIVHFE